MDRFNDTIREAFGGKNAFTDKEFFASTESLTRQTRDHGLLHLSKGFIKMKDATPELIEAIADRIRRCPFAVDARAVGELFEPALGNVRIDVLMSVTDPARLDTSDVTFKFIFEGQA